MARPKKYNVSLADDEVKKLKSIIRKKGTTRTVRCRCQILLDLDEAHGKLLTYEQTAKSNGVCISTVQNAAKIFAIGGIPEVTTINHKGVNSGIFVEGDFPGAVRFIDKNGVLRIGILRKLMPIESWRLQGFSDEQFKRAAALRLRDGQLYKMAGNAVSVPVIKAIGEKNP